MDRPSGAEEVAYAKINLALHVRGRRPDGYHRIETIFAFAEEGDLLRAESADTISLKVEGPFATDIPDGEENLVLRAARALAKCGEVTTGAALTLSKRLPVASGIGGGSADAAAALRLLNRLWYLDYNVELLAGIAADLGADVPACVASRSALGRGKGDELDPVEAVPAGTPLLLVNPGVKVATAEVFKRWKGGDGGPLPRNWREGRNDLQAPAEAIAPEIGAVLEMLARQPGATVARMSGSGASCFALFGSESERGVAAARIRAEHPAWWQLSSRIR
ncbi:MAG TPA: 4-(cytidine 5'-diphospho)-2-C-methyl-D-erythritol kinase [Allosphingosinicella sp.]